MKLHDLKPSLGSKKDKIRVGRGTAGRRGKTAGRGIKGQKARSGGGKGPFFEGGQLPLVRRLPFRRGFTNIWRVEYAPVNIGYLQEKFGDSGQEVTPETLAAAGLLKHPGQPVAILGDGELTSAFTVKAHRFSQSAKAKIEAAGGTIEILPLS